MPALSQIQFGQYPFLYVNGLNISNDATTPNTKLDVAAGSCLDSTSTFQMFLTTAVVINAANNGLNGLDTGSLAASTVYAVYVIGDQTYANPTGCIISANLTTPLLPFGYGIYRLIGYVTTDGSSNFLLGLWKGNDTSRRSFMYASPQATSISASNDTSYTAASLVTVVPATADQRFVYLNASFTPGAASRVLNLRPTGNAPASIIITGQVAAVPITQFVYMFARNSSGNPSIDYQVSNAGDAATVNVLGYDYFL